MPQLKFPSSPVANAGSIVGGSHSHKFRFTILTDGLLRYEWAPDGEFEDRASVFAIHRGLPTPDYRTKESPTSLEIITSRFSLYYDKEAFSPSGFSIVVKGAFGCHASVWRYGEASGDMGGTARTLDAADGRIPVGQGVVSRNGFSSIDDSASMLFTEDGFVAPRRPGERVDGYMFAYGHDYREAVKAFFSISGHQPLLPRWALGNWWSRYYDYSAEEYIELMDKFRDEGIPFSVAVLDMDWHLTGTDPRVIKSGATGWTGYSWNKELFPDPPAFLEELHKRNLKVTLNDHPAEGVHSYEDGYEDMAKALGYDTSQRDEIAFDIVDEKFLNAYLDVLHRKLEDEGVDFWWIDWQQGSHSRIPGIDPLWVLNHYSFLDNAREKKRPLTFSRYAGPGSHRYPVGFSGDAIITWESLDFQPEFTATASNIGYGWWSHDIGGHMNGYRDDELATRWLQLGVFSPIMRLHSSNSEWNAKEPWRFNAEAQKTMTSFLRLRHQLIPYIYTMNVRAATEGSTLVQPIYWRYSERDEAYKVPNQYFFGTELLVCPITSPRDGRLQMGQVKGWFPPGRYVDIFSGAVYEGDRELWISRPLDTYPVFAQEGSIIPTDFEGQVTGFNKNPTCLRIMVAVGADGRFDLLEDNGVDSAINDIQITSTPIKYTQSSGKLSVGPASGGSAAPKSRNISMNFLGVRKVSSLQVLVGGQQIAAKQTAITNGILVELGSISTREEISITIGDHPRLADTDPQKPLYPVINGARIEFGLKEQIWTILKANISKTSQISRLHALDMDPKILNAIFEYLLVET